MNEWDISPGHAVQESSRSGSVGVDAAAGVLRPKLAQNKQSRERKLIWTIDEAEIPRQRGMAAKTFGAAEGLGGTEKPAKY